MIKLVAFDWNGTLFSDARAVVESVNKVFGLFKLEPMSLAHFRNHFNVPVRSAYIAMGIPEKGIEKKSAEIAKTFHSNYELRAAKVRTRAFAKELLSWLTKQGICSVIFSNHIDEPIKKQLRRLKIDHYFSAVLANSNLETVFQERAKQIKLENFLHEHKINASEVLIIGDTVEEIEIGKKLGIQTIAIIHGFCTVSRLKKANPDFLINSLKEVISIIKNS